MWNSAFRIQEKMRNLHKHYNYLSKKLQEVEMNYYAENDVLSRIKLEWHKMWEQTPVRAVRA